MGAEVDVVLLVAVEVGGGVAIVAAHGDHLLNRIVGKAVGSEGLSGDNQVIVVNIADELRPAQVEAGAGHVAGNDILGGVAGTEGASADGVAPEGVAIIADHTHLEGEFGLGGEAGQLVSQHAGDGGGVDTHIGNEVGHIVGMEVALPCEVDGTASTVGNGHIGGSTASNRSQGDVIKIDIGIAIAIVTRSFEVEFDIVTGIGRSVKLNNFLGPTAGTREGSGKSGTAIFAHDANLHGEVTTGRILVPEAQLSGIGDFNLRSGKCIGHIRAIVVAIENNTFTFMSHRSTRTRSFGVVAPLVACSRGGTLAVIPADGNRTGHSQVVEILSIRQRNNVAGGLAADAAGQSGAVTLGADGAHVEGVVGSSDQIVDAEAGVLGRGNDHGFGTLHNAHLVGGLGVLGVNPGNLQTVGGGAVGNHSQVLHRVAGGQGGAADGTGGIALIAFAADGVEADAVGGLTLQANKGHGAFVGTGGGLDGHVACFGNATVGAFKAFAHASEAHGQGGAGGHAVDHGDIGHRVANHLVEDEVVEHGSVAATATVVVAPDKDKVVVVGFSHIERIVVFLPLGLTPKLAIEKRPGRGDNTSLVKGDVGILGSQIGSHIVVGRSFVFAHAAPVEAQVIVAGFKLDGEVGVVATATAGIVAGGGAAVFRHHHHIIIVVAIIPVGVAFVDSPYGGGGIDVGGEDVLGLCLPGSVGRTNVLGDHITQDISVEFHAVHKHTTAEPAVGGVAGEEPIVHRILGFEIVLIGKLDIDRIVGKDIDGGSIKPAVTVARGAHHEGVYGGGGEGVVAVGAGRSSEEDAVDKLGTLIHKHLVTILLGVVVGPGDGDAVGGDGGGDDIADGLAFQVTVDGDVADVEGGVTGARLGALGVESQVDCRIAVLVGCEVDGVDIPGRRDGGQVRAGVGAQGCPVQTVGGGKNDKLLVSSDAVGCPAAVEGCQGDAVGDLRVGQTHQVDGRRDEPLVAASLEQGVVVVACLQTVDG